MRIARLSTTGFGRIQSNSKNVPAKQKGNKLMKKLILAIIGLMTLNAVYAQQTIVVERPGIFTDLVNAAGALVTLPFAVAEGLVTGTVEAAGSLISGSTEVVVTPAPVIVPAPAVCSRTIAPAPVVVAPQVVAPAPVVVAPQVVAPAPVMIPSTTVVTTNNGYTTPRTTIVTTYCDGTVTSVTRDASAYELGPVVIPPVAPEHRVGTSPFVNPYVYRHR